MTNNKLTESESLSEKDFKNVLENKLSVLLTQGDWTASLSVHPIKLDMGVKTLTYRNDSGLFIFLHDNKVEVVTSGHVVKLTNPSLVSKLSEMYYTKKAQQDFLEQSRKQQMVLETISKLTYNLEINK